EKPPAPAPAPAPTTAAKPAEAEKPKTEADRHIIPAGSKPPPMLLQATKKGNVEAVKALLDDDKTDPNDGLDGHTALHEAVGAGNLEIVKLLLDKGANASVHQKIDGATPLHIAAVLPNGLESAKMLLDHGAEVNALDLKKRTPLIGAAFKGNVETVHLL